MKVAILDYNAGNIYSVTHAVKRLGLDPIVTNDRALLEQADKLIFPGQGEAGTTMASLRATGLDQFIRNTNKPVLGICIGMQLMCRRSEESNTECLGIFDTEVRRFCPTLPTDKIPQMGWNQLEKINPKGFIPTTFESEFVYYVHSYYVPLNDHTIAQTEFTLPYSAALQKDNFYAVQFHPEKSGSIGEQLLDTFFKLPY